MNAENLSTKFHEIGQSPGTLLEMNSGLSGDFRLLSTLGRAGYKFKSRYLLEASLRLDATSKFSPEKQNATFGSVGAGWIVSEESFFKNSISWMNLLKVRGSVGQTGNGDMPDFKYMNAYTIGKWFMNQQYSYIQNIGNPEITWETSNNSDVGIDFGLFKSKINGSIAYYKKNVNGLLLEVPLPMSAGIPGGNTVWQNIGDMSNSGVEITLNYTPVKTSDFSWDMSFNFSTNKNEILALHPAVDAKGWGIEGYQTITRTGGKLATFYLPEYAGIDPERGIPMIYERDADIYSTTGETVKTGKQIPFNSVTGAANRFIQDGKSSMPDWYGGFNNNFRYKSFDLNLMFSYAGNSYFINEAARSSRNVSFGWQRLADDILENSWKQPGDNAKYQELIYGGGYYYDSEGNKIDKPVEEYGMASTRELTSNDYLRLRFVTLGYNLPASLVNKIRLSGIRVYTSINNAFTISKAPAEIDPELGIPGNLEGNFVYYGLPPVRTFSFGVSINF
jgi:TonB-linked SusC/RagA family outer membrane protein